ncbi:MAG: cupin domain-containing protein [Sulfuricurvum sp.]|nr:cupin domain-containing protein [Sulfuricurvum sp.]
MNQIENIYNRHYPDENHEIFSPIFTSPALRIESIRSWLKTPGEWYNQNEDEWVLLLEGEALLELDNKTFALIKGNYLFIPKQTKHRVLSTSENALWLGIFSS